VYAGFGGDDNVLWYNFSIMKNMKMFTLVIAGLIILGVGIFMYLD